MPHNRRCQKCGLIDRNGSWKKFFAHDFRYHCRNNRPKERPRNPCKKNHEINKISDLIISKS